MDSTEFISFSIEDRSFTSIAKREIQKRLRKAEFGAQKAGELDIIVSELCSNLVKHSVEGGQIILRVIADDKHPYCEIFCMDGGPGINDVQKMMKDGASSSNTLGQGLGAISRLSDRFQIYSLKGWGTLAYVKKYNENLTPRQLSSHKTLEVRAIQQAIEGEVLCGDGYHIKHLPNETQVFLGDGLGHGPHAHDAVQLAIRAFSESKETSPVEILRDIHEKVKKTRGLVATIAILNHKQKEWRICGVGNIATRLYHGVEYKSYMSYNGIIGLNIANTMSDTVHDAHRFQFFVMCSDGIRTKWDLTKYTSILKYDSALIAAAIFKDHARHTDDMSVLVGKVNLEK